MIPAPLLRPRRILSCRPARSCLLLLVLLGGCTRFDVLNATIPSRTYFLTQDIAYGGLPRQQLDVYRPRTPSPPAGIVVFFYGGDWQAGRKEDYRFVAEALASRGFIAVIPDYRLYPAVTFPRFVEDGAFAVRWAHDNARRLGSDPDHLYLMGHSAGAHIAALLTLDRRYLNDVGLKRSDIRATATLSGPYDFTPGPNDRGVFDMAPGQAPDPSIEPVTFVGPDAPPILVVHGLRDTIVRPDNPLMFVNRLRAAGGRVEYIAYPSRGHADLALALAAPFRGLAPVLDDVAAFFRQH